MFIDKICKKVPRDNVSVFQFLVDQEVMLQSKQNQNLPKEKSNFSRICCWKFDTFGSTYFNTGGGGSSDFLLFLI